MAALTALLLVLVGAVRGCTGGGHGQGADGASLPTQPTQQVPMIEDRNDPPPTILPTPRSMRWIGPDVTVPGTVALVAAEGVDRPTTDLVTEVLTRAGAERVQDGESPDAALTVRIGPPSDRAVGGALAAVGLDAPSPIPAEGYALAAFVETGSGGVGGQGDPANRHGTVIIAADDPAGAFYGAQTLRQLTTGPAIAGVGMVDSPAMPLRGTVEGFYGSPWTPQERLDQLDFYGRTKLNTYVYAPKDDPYHRDRWREPYPRAELERLRGLVRRAEANHVRFTFAVSPGVSICYSNPTDVEALSRKLQAVYDLGVRSFSVALDDIDYTRWNCDADARTYGPAGAEAAAHAQAALLNTIQRDFVGTHQGVHPLQTVPTEYQGIDDSPYRRALRTDLDRAVEVMWTGALVVPAEITVDQATAAAEVFGRRPLIWDNTPVNDFSATEGRLLLGPYARRQPGLAAHVDGILSNPMNQAAASKVALTGVADFTWNDRTYDPARAHRAAAAALAARDGGRASPEVIDALLAFFDVETLAPTSAHSLSMPQAPALAAQLDAFRSAWAGAGGNRASRRGAVDQLRPYAERLAGASQVIRDGVTDRGFLSDCGPWLDATALWGRALVATADGLEARAAGDAVAADAAFARADDLAAQARAIHTIPGETLPQGPVRVADGVLDTFLAEAPTLR